MEALILAGGRGTRLQSVVSDRPKPMALIHDKPFLHYQIQQLVYADVTHIILSVGYLHEQIEDYFGANYLGVKISYARESAPLGTGGAIVNALGLVMSNDFFILNGDTFFAVDFGEVEKIYTETRASLVMAVKYMPDASRYGLVSFDAKDRVMQFLEKQEHSSGYINGGIYLVNKSIFSKYIAGENYSFESILADSCISTSMLVYKCIADFIDIGIPEDYHRAGELIPHNF